MGDRISNYRLTAAIFLLVASLHAAGAELSGKLVDASGAPLPQAVVVLRSEPDFGRQHKQRTNEQGVFTFRDLEAGRYQLDSASPGFAWKSVSAIEVSPGETKALGALAVSIPDVSTTCRPGPLAVEDIQFLPTGVRTGTLSGSIELANHEALSGVDVVLFCPYGRVCGHAITDANGMYSFSALAPGKYSIKATKAGFSVEERRGLESREGLQVNFRAVFVIRCAPGLCDATGRRLPEPGSVGICFDGRHRYRDCRNRWPAEGRAPSHFLHRRCTSA
ncbi:MAG: carboxypeptidase regulatory-like domain-containing protein [Acidobacteria bacterium]|nr:carboxypeptidase regulatory-like domain-containing protein [Acidobacteriota bacterium]